MNAFDQLAPAKAGTTDVEEYVLDFLEQLADLSKSVGLNDLASDLEIVRQSQLSRQ